MDHHQSGDAYPNPYDSGSPTPSPETTRHTQFLDLTNGEGGERDEEEEEDDDYDDDEAMDGGAAVSSSFDGPSISTSAQIRAVGGGDESPSDTQSARKSALATGSGGGLSLRNVNPHTPGKVVETGQEHTGRWTKEEHEAFLTALQMYGKEWKKVAAKVKTRTVVQTRTHAQKYFQKLAKVVESGKEDVTHVEMGVASEARKSTGQKKKRSVPSIAASPSKPHRQSSVTMAANVISTMGVVPGSAQASQTGSHYSISTPPSILTRPGHVQALQGVRLSEASHGFSTSDMPGSASRSFPSSSYASPGFPPDGGGSNGGVEEPTSSTSFSMKILAPEHDAATRRGKFPEPSPAACGKRKLAEIAAARMLAGVAASGGSADQVGSKGSLLSTALMDQQSQMPFSRQPFAASDADGTATPPPEPAISSHDTGRTLELKRMPAPPLVGVRSIDGASSETTRKPLGLSLQIVNPESLGVTHDQSKRRRGADGQASPVTPWEGQLEALVSEEAKTGGGESINATGLPSLPDPTRMGFDALSFPHPICGPGSAYGRSFLHKAVCEMDMAAIENELAAPHVNVALSRHDKMGFSPIHSACCLGMNNSQNHGIALDIVRKLLSAGVDAATCDSKGNTPLHWAARSGAQTIAELLIRKSSSQDARNEHGESPLHWAMRAGRAGMEVVKVLIENGARPALFNNEFRRPIDVCADGYHDEEGSIMELKKLISQRKRLTKDQKQQLKDAAAERRDARANLLNASHQSRTLILQHPECLEHIPKSASDWEVPDRVTSIMDRVMGKKVGDSTTRAIYDHEIVVSQEFDRASLDLLSRVHSTKYLKFVHELSKDLERKQKELNGDSSSSTEDQTTPPVVPFTPMVQRSMIKIAESSVKEGLHSDTSFSAGSLRAARRAAGAVQHAVDCVLVGRNRNAFCVVRPPGHHAGINGLLDGGESCGFCIFNSVAAGAMHAISDERLLCERCAIVDIDVHHGNGTEEIVRKCHDPSKLFFFSIHLYDNEKKGKRETKNFQYKFYPGTGDEDDIALNIINVPISPLWKDKEQSAPNVSVHNTRHRAKKRTQDKEDGDSSEAGTPKASDAESDQAYSRGVGSATSSPTVPNPSASMGGRVAYRRAIQNRLLPALRAFNPDLILISAGFDASKGDVGNAKHEIGGKEKMGIDLDPEDYAWTTRKILEIADICCHGRVVSVLEGGYGRTPARASDEKNAPLDKGVLSECAVRHLHAMIDPYDTEGRFNSSS